MILLCTISWLKAQDKQEMLQGNSYYKKQEFNKALQAYKKAEKKNKTPDLTYNLGNAYYKSNIPEEAEKAYDETIETAAPNLKEKAYYNKGVALQNKNLLPQCIEAYKNALRINPDDTEARQNLQKALQQLKQQQQQKEDKKNTPKNPEQKKQDPQPQQSKLSPQKVEQLLQSLREKEKLVQQRVAKQKMGVPKQPEKDW